MTKLFEVGGKVRDELLGRFSTDVDFIVQGSTVEEVKLFLKENNISTFAFKPEYNVIRGKFPKTHPTYPDMLADFTVVYADIFNDLSKRDFTINAIAKDLQTGEYIDPFNGQYHLKQGLLVCPSEPLDVLKSDPIRIIRALRFCYLFKFQMNYELETAVRKFEYNDFFVGKLDRLVRELKKVDLAGKIFIFNKLKELNEPIYDWVDCHLKFTPSAR